METLDWCIWDNSNTLHLTFTTTFAWINIVHSFNLLCKENIVLWNCISLEHITIYIQDDVAPSPIHSSSSPLIKHQLFIWHDQSSVLVTKPWLTHANLNSQSSRRKRRMIENYPKITNVQFVHVDSLALELDGDGHMMVGIINFPCLLPLSFSPHGGRTCQASSHKHMWKNEHPTQRDSKTVLCGTCWSDLLTCVKNTICIFTTKCRNRAQNNQRVWKKSKAT
jgi:hypothetical protein